MYFVMSKRVVKVNTGQTEKFAPRTSNHVTWTASGPFAKRSLAERAAAGALGTHTCLGAMVFSDAEIAELFRRPGHEQPWSSGGTYGGGDPQMRAAFSQAHSMFLSDPSIV